MQLSPFVTLVRPSISSPPPAPPFTPLPERRGRAQARVIDATTRTQPDGEEIGELATLCRIIAAREAVPPSVELDVGLAPHSDSNLVIGLDGAVRGVFYATYEELELGTRVGLTLHLPGDHSIRAVARVEWIRWPECGATPGLGLCFVDISSSDGVLLACFAEGREPLLFED